MKALMVKFILWVLDLLTKKFVSDNLRSFKIDFKRMKPKVRAWEIKHNKGIAWVFYIGDRGYAICISMAICLLMAVTAIKCSVEPNNSLALPLFCCVSLIALALFTLIMFAPMEPKPIRKK
jgi:lipoprotein signal peptidase